MARETDRRLRLSPMEFNFGFGKGGGERPEARPFRVLLVGDFSGRGVLGQVEPLAGRRTHALDIDTFDEVMARIGPRVRVGGEEVSFESLDDFHPDALFKRMAALTALRDLRRRLKDPATAATAEAEVKAWEHQPASSTVIGAPTGAPAGNAADLMSSLLGGTVKQPEGPKGVDVQAFIKGILGKDSSAPAQASAAALAAVDARLSRTIRAVLRDPAFAALERAWRGAHWLMTSLELDETLQLHIMDVSSAEIATDGAGLVKSIADPARNIAGETPWAIIVSADVLEKRVEHAAVARALADAAAACAGVAVAGAGPSHVGAASFADADPDAWTNRPTDDAVMAWRQVRGERLVLAGPRVILRQPYGAQSDPVDTFSFDEFEAGELGSDEAHEAYAWGAGSLAVAAVVGAAFSAEGWNLDASAGGDVGELAVHSWIQGGERKVKPCAEAYLPERALERLTSAGIVALASVRGRDAVRVSPVQTLEGGTLNWNL